MIVSRRADSIGSREILVNFAAAAAENEKLLYMSNN